MQRFFHVYLLKHYKIAETPRGELVVKRLINLNALFFEPVLLVLLNSSVIFIY